MNAEKQVVVSQRGCSGFLLLNRPQALNALTSAMVREVHVALDAFELDAGVKRVVIQGAGGRAFCAGGDIRHLYELGRAGDHGGQLKFFADEYRLNLRLQQFGKPLVALIDGVVMGGGVGVSMHGSHRVVTERAVFAMPEVGIGFFPDVGATYLLPRLPRRFGVAMAATGLRADAGDMAALGLATAFVPSAKLEALAAALERPGDADRLIGEFAVAPPPSPLSRHAEAVERCFADPDLAAIEAALQAEGSTFAQDLLAMLAVKSPTSVAIALRQVRLGGSLAFEDAMRLEFRIVSRIVRGHDFYEGVRAAIVEKDNRPAWRPPAGGRPTAAEIDAYFAPLGDNELDVRGDVD